MDTLGTRLMLVRRELGISQAEAARRCNLTARVWQNMEDGRATRHELENIKRIALAFQVDRDWLMFGGPLEEEAPEGDDPSGQEKPGTGAGQKRPSSLYKEDTAPVIELFPAHTEPERTAA
jgi:transcriptional regulator with XRE-family HTH domain